MKKWKIFKHESCPNCGDAVEVLSECPVEQDADGKQWFYDGEDAKCSMECGWIGAVSADEDSVYLQDGNIDELTSQQGGGQLNEAQTRRNTISPGSHDPNGQLPEKESQAPN